MILGKEIPRLTKQIQEKNFSYEATVSLMMHDQGARGVRFNLFSGNGTPEDQLDTLARRLAPLGWHIQVYADGATIKRLDPQKYTDERFGGFEGRVPDGTPPLITRVIGR